jgi:hypothetical protein
MKVEFWLEYVTMDGRVIPRLRQGPFKTEAEALKAPPPAVRYSTTSRPVRVVRVEEESGSVALLNKVIP